MDNPDMVEQVARALCDHFEEDWSDVACRESWIDAARAAIAALTTPADGLGERPRKLTLTMPNGDVLKVGYPNDKQWAESWDIGYPPDGVIRTTGEQDDEIVERYGLTAILEAFEAALRAAQPTERAGAFMEAAATCDAMAADKSLPADAHTAAWNLAVGFRYKARQAIERTEHLTPTDTPAVPLQPAAPARHLYINPGDMTACPKPPHQETDNGR